MLLRRLQLYWYLTRMDKPVGTLLLLWPTLCALWIASEGKPSFRLVGIFTLGTVLMRSAGCVLNDLADRDIDRYVERTAQRPLTCGKIGVWEALMVAVILVCAAFFLVLSLNGLTIVLSLVALVIAMTYPLFKRFFVLPQAYLGVAFGFGIPMAFSAVLGKVPSIAWCLLLGNIFWTLAYDTEYAMVDREDDLKLGLYTSAITFGRFDVHAVMSCYVLMMAIIFAIGWHLGLGLWSFAGWCGAWGCIAYHYWLIRNRMRQCCFKAFRHNNWVGFFLFVGVVLDYALR